MNLDLGASVVDVGVAVVSVSVDIVDGKKEGPIGDGPVTDRRLSAALRQLTRARVCRA